MSWDKNLAGAEEAVSGGATASIKTEVRNYLEPAPPPPPSRPNNYGNQKTSPALIIVRWAGGEKAYRVLIGVVAKSHSVSLDDDDDAGSDDVSGGLLSLGKPEEAGGDADSMIARGDGTSPRRRARPSLVS